MQLIKIGSILRLWREKSGLGPIKAAAPVLGVSHTSLGMYEREETLPDVDFLAVFAQKTGADFNELLKARLASGKTEEARALAATVGASSMHDAGKVPSFQAILDRAETTLEQSSGLIPITLAVEAQNQELARVKKELEFIAGCQDATEKVRAKADMMLRVAFEATPAHERFNIAINSVGDKMRKAEATVDQACSAAGYQPSALMLHILRAMVWDGLIERQLVMLVSALAQEQQTQPK